MQSHGARAFDVFRLVVEEQRLGRCDSDAVDRVVDKWRPRALRLPIRRKRSHDRRDRESRAWRARLRPAAREIREDGGADAARAQMRGPAQDALVELFHSSTSYWTNVRSRASSIGRPAGFERFGSNRSTDRASRHRSQCDAPRRVRRSSCVEMPKRSAMRAKRSSEGWKQSTPPKSKITALTDFAGTTEPGAAESSGVLSLRESRAALRRFGGGLINSANRPRPFPRAGCGFRAPHRCGVPGFQNTCGSALRPAGRCRKESRRSPAPARRR